MVESNTDSIYASIVEALIAWGENVKIEVGNTPGKSITGKDMEGAEEEDVIIWEEEDGEGKVEKIWLVLSFDKVYLWCMWI